VEAAMHEAEGDLLIGGDRIKRLHIDLEAEQQQDGSAEWTLTGHLHVTAEQSQLLETDRPYRLQLADGRCGQVIVSRIAADGKPNELLADFLPKQVNERSAAGVAGRENA
jgi:hypothetical protein